MTSPSSSGTGTGTGAASGGASGSAFGDFVIYVAIALIFGGVTDWLTKKYIPFIPYTVLIFMGGALISLVVNTSPYGELNRSMDFTKIPGLIPRIFLFAFLPVLIFGDGLHLNWHHVKASLSKALLLAGPGVVFRTLIIAAIAAPLVGWSFPEALVFSSILSATDTVAVSTLLKTAGASHQLTILIVGESLLSEGTAIVLFQLFLNVTANVTITGSYVVVYFLKEAICSILFGIGIGWVANQIIRRVDREGEKADMTVHISITIITAYISFLVAGLPELLHISGVLSAAAAGLILANFGPSYVMLSEEMHTAWEILEWLGNTLIFFFAGLVSASVAIDDNGIGIDWIYIYRTVVIYIALFVIRAVTLAFSYPILSRGNVKFDTKELAFSTWSALRGALAIALALSLPSSISTDVAEDMFLLIVGIIAMTLVINATTAKPLLHFLGLTEESRSDKLEKAQIEDLMRHRLRRQMRSEAGAIAEQCHCTPESIGDYCSLLNNGHNDDNNEDFSSFGRETFQVKSDVRNVGSEVDAAGLNLFLLRFIRLQFYEALRVQYRKRILDGSISRLSYSSHTLLHGIDHAADFLSDDLKDWDYIEHELAVPAWLLIIAKFIDRSMLYLFNINTRIYGKVVAKRERRQLYVFENYIDTHEETQKQIPSFLGGDENDQFWIPEELKVREESRALVARVRLLIAHKFNEDTVNKFQAQKAARILLVKQSQKIHSLLESGLLGEQQGKKLLDALEKDQLELNVQRNELGKAFVRARPEAYDQEVRRGHVISVNNSLHRRPSNANGLESQPQIGVEHSLDTTADAFASSKPTTTALKRTSLQKNSFEWKPNDPAFKRRNSAISDVQHFVVEMVPTALRRSSSVDRPSIMGENEEDRPSVGMTLSDVIAASVDLRPSIGPVQFAPFSSQSTSAPITVTGSGTSDEEVAIVDDKSSATAAESKYPSFS